jgi:acyl carrier protein
MKNFEEGLAELLEVDSVQEFEVLEDFESWDSLTSLSIIAFIDESFEVSVSAKDFTEVKTVGGLKSFVMSKSKK